MAEFIRTAKGWILGSNLPPHVPAAAGFDTGNPVSVISAASCTELFGTVNAVIFVPFRSVGKDSGILPAVRADRMEIEKEGQKKIIEKPYIAISEEKLSQNDSYQILLNEKLWV